MTEIDPEIARYYTETWDEDARLRSGLNELELVRTREIVRRHLSERALEVLDVGGGGGVHAEWLLDDGHAVHLIDPMASHVDQAITSLGEVKGFSAEVADGRSLPVDDASFDVVLLFGPLYHLPDRADRALVWREAKRVVRPGGLVFAAAISRFASLYGGLTEREIFVDEFRAIVQRDLATGHHQNTTRNERYFTAAYFQHPEELEAESAEAGFTVREVLAVEGLAGALPQLEQDWGDPERRGIIIESARMVESEPSLLGASPHILLVAERPIPAI